MTGKQVAYYLGHNGVRCPFCRSADISGVEAPTVDDGGCTQHIKCLKCGKRWYDIYKLIAIEEVHV